MNPLSSASSTPLRPAETRSQSARPIPAAAAPVATPSRRLFDANPALGVAAAALGHVSGAVLDVLSARQANRLQAAVAGPAKAYTSAPVAGVGGAVDHIV